MRIILDTDKKTITVPWNYQQKLDGINEIIMQVSNDESKKKTFTGYIDEIWKEAIENDWRKTNSWQPGWEYDIGFFVK